MVNIDNATAPSGFDLSNTRSIKTVARAHLLRLPSELLLDIIGYLDIVTVAILSRTCARFRALAHRDWKQFLRQLLFVKKLVFWGKIAFDSPNHSVCQNCHRMHRINHADVPQTCNVVPPCVLTPQNRSLAISLNPYKVRPQHVQTALKLSRLGNIHQGYLEKLMTPFTRNRQPDDRGHLQYFAAMPKIISGGYLLRKEWIFKSGGECHFEDVHGQIRRAPLVCYHMIIAFMYSSLREWNLAQKYRLYPQTPFDESFWYPVCNIGKEFKEKCANCSDRTEYSILCPDKYTMIIRAWYDYGTETHDDGASITGFLEKKMPRRGSSSQSIREIFDE
ncbi:F-box domain containing protein [Colletotrichum chrysophilum]|uniref:F-box domain containing protein n=1 Tax=Colletotrichum chrysophilum TaxID=1836956 RepID=A0AAD9AS35_9PEZI|nr:F-box domain containing protein [Colletotrichum chrysophilum]